MVRYSLLMLVGQLRDGRVTTFCFVRGYGHRRAWRIMATRARLAGLMLDGLRVVCLRSGRRCSCGAICARLSWPPHGQLGLRGFRRAAAGGRIAECCLCRRHVCFGAG